LTKLDSVTNRQTDRQTHRITVAYSEAECTADISAELTPENSNSIIMKNAWCNYGIKGWMPILDINSKHVKAGH